MVVTAYFYLERFQSNRRQSRWHSGLLYIKSPGGCLDGGGPGMFDVDAQPRDVCV